MKKSELRQIIREEVGKIIKPEVTQLVNILMSRMGYKKYQLGIETAYGVYLITLPISTLSLSDLKKLQEILPEGTMVGIYRDIFSGLSIKTNISIK